jgi:hypothetical protein
MSQTPKGCDGADSAMPSRAALSRLAGFSTCSRLNDLQTPAFEWKQETDPNHEMESDGQHGQGWYLVGVALVAPGSRQGGPLAARTVGERRGWVASTPSRFARSRCAASYCCRSPGPGPCDCPAPPRGSPRCCEGPAPAPLIAPPRGSCAMPGPRRSSTRPGRSCGLGPRRCST